MTLATAAQAKSTRNAAYRSMSRGQRAQSLSVPRKHSETKIWHCLLPRARSPNQCEVPRFCPPRLRAGRDGQVRTRCAFHERVVFTGMPLPTACTSCSERELCGGGYLPHRYSKRRCFDNPSVWCEDIRAMLRYLRLALGVDHEETELRRSALHSLRAEHNLQGSRT